MKFTLDWLKTHLDTQAGVGEIADALTRIGLEVEAVTNAAERLGAFRVAKVLSATPHPQADKLQVLSVDAGEGPVQVVCGAPNARAGLVGVFGAPGAIVPSNGMVLKVAAIRGVESNGMMCSSRELELGDDHDGIIELPDTAPVGAAYAAWAGLDAAVFDVAVTPNRQDCMGVRGIARDLAAAGVGSLKPLAVPQIDGMFDCPVAIRIDDPAGCPAFYGRVIRGVTGGPSPDWIKARLEAIGQRPISVIVDITNYVMFDLGRPSHAYDLAQLTGAVVARRAAEGEQVTALNGKTFALTPEATVIADDRQVHDIGGIMGGVHSGISDTTTDILLEVAYFTPERIAVTGQTLGLTSDARARFERGVDPAFLDDAINILTGIIIGICGGEASRVARIGSPPAEKRTIAYDTGLCLRLGGIDVAAREQEAILSRLGFEVANDWSVTIPTWRRDIDGPADLVEEVVRISGLDNVVSTALPRREGVAQATATPLQKRERKVRRVAAARGLNEAITWSFISESEAAAFGGGPWTLANPISEDLKVMRTSLLPGLLSAARRNADRGADSIRLFEIGRTYQSQGEPLTMGIVLAGQRTTRDWSAGRASPFDAFDAKAEALALLHAAGAPTDNVQVFGDAGDHYHPGQSGTLRLGPKTVLASFGTLHAQTVRHFGLSGAVVVAELHLEAVPLKRSTGFARPPFAPPMLQVVRRDFAFVVPADLASDVLVRAVQGADKTFITGARVFDLFTGAGVPDGHKSLAIEVTLQPAEKSFTEDQLSAIAAKIVAAANKLGASLRS